MFLEPRSWPYTCGTPLWGHAPSVSLGPEWLAWQLLPSTNPVSSALESWEPSRLLCFPQTPWKLCVCESPHLPLHRYSLMHCSCRDLQEGSCHQQNLSGSRCRLLNLWLNFSDWSSFSNYVPSACNLGFCCCPKLCSWVFEVARIWEVTVSECQGHRLVACTICQGSFRNEIIFHFEKFKCYFHDTNYLKFICGCEYQFTNLTETLLSFPFWSTFFASWTLIPLIWWDILSLVFLDVLSSTLSWHQSSRDFHGNGKKDEEALTSGPTWLVLIGLHSRPRKFHVCKGSLLYCRCVFGTPGPDAASCTM